MEIENNKGGEMRENREKQKCMFTC